MVDAEDAAPAWGRVDLKNVPMLRSRGGVVQVEALDHVGVPVSDIDRSIDWYPRVLGLGPGHEPQEAGITRRQSGHQVSRSL